MDAALRTVAPARRGRPRQSQLLDAAEAQPGSAPATLATASHSEIVESVGSTRESRPERSGTGNKLDRDGRGDEGDAGADGSGEHPAHWLAGVQAHLSKADGLTDGQLPVKLAQAVIAKADTMIVPDVVQALERCENMALKLKAAKFLKDTGKNTVEEMRRYAAQLMEGEPDGEAT